MLSYPSRLLCFSVRRIRRNVFNVGGSSTGSQEIRIHLKRWKEEGVEIVIISMTALSLWASSKWPLSFSSKVTRWTVFFSSLHWPSKYLMLFLFLLVLIGDTSLTNTPCTVPEDEAPIETNQFDTSIVRNHVKICVSNRLKCFW